MKEGGGDNVIALIEKGGAPIPQRFYSTAGKYGFTVLPEDEEPDEINHCTFEQLPSPSLLPPFDYYDFMEFNRLQVLLYHLQSMKNGVQAEEAKVPSDFFIKTLFYRMYGVVDFKSPEMQEALQSMKETLMEQSPKKPSEYSEILIQLLDEGIEVPNPILAETQLKQLISTKFGEEKITRYTTLNPREADGEWFVLPRGTPKSIRERNFIEVSYPIEITEDSQGNTNAHDAHWESSEPPLRNLVLYDPKFEFTHRIFTKDNPNWEIQDGIPPGVSRQILSHLNNYPLGISMMEFWISYMSKYPRPSVGKLTLSEILLQHEKELWIVKNPGEDLPPLVFPSFMENIICPDTVLKRAWHIMKCVVVKHSFISEDDLFSFLAGPSYHLKFRPEDWGFENIGAFVKFCNKKFGTAEISVHRVVFTEEGGVVRQLDYVLFDCNHLKRHVEALHGIVPEKKVPLVKEIPEDFLGKDEIIEAISNDLSILNVIACGLKFMRDPSNMFVGWRKFGERLEDFMNMLTSFKDVDAVIKKPAPAPNIIWVGMYALAFVEQYTGGGWRAGTKEWFRVKVLRRTPDGEKYETYSIDYGFTSVVPLADMRLMPRGQASSEPAHAIPIRLKLKHPERHRGFRRVVGDEMTNIMFDIVDAKMDNLVVTLRSGRFQQSLGCLKWKVTCSVTKRSPEKAVVHRDIVPVFYQRYGAYLELENKRKEELERKRKAAAAKEDDIKKDVADANTSVSESDKISSDDYLLYLDEAPVCAKQEESRGKIVAGEETSSDSLE